MATTKFWATVTSKLFLTGAVVALAAVGWGVIKSAVKRAEVEREVQALRQEIGEHEARNDELEQLLNYLGTSEFKEREARLRLGLQKPGEQVVVIPGLAESLSSGTAAAAPAEPPNWRSWFDYFFGAPEL